MFYNLLICLKVCFINVVGVFYQINHIMELWFGDWASIISWSLPSEVLSPPASSSLSVMMARSLVKSRISFWSFLTFFWCHLSSFLRTLRFPIVALSFSIFFPRRWEFLMTFNFGILELATSICLTLCWRLGCCCWGICSG